ncbi:MAG: DEAD/DEAH box helicase, partial [Treponema sp.]|nr:DEAD/DEAH box helicase [Treponema sp.]
MSALPTSFHPLILEWFADTFGKPTAVQAGAWPLIERGENVLALAPTGSGKTLTAFLSAISRFCNDAGSGTGYHVDRLTVLYVSPLKALNEDIKRNLLQPLAEIRLRFEKAGIPFPGIRVETRSGDTPQSERRRFLSHPPSILALTPESLAILLLNPKGRLVLSTVRYLILDEIHAVLGNKRGSYLSCQIDRLAMIAGEFQRISLSATVRPPEVAAAFVAGLSGNGQARPIRIVAPSSPLEKRIEFTIVSPGEVGGHEIEPGKYGKRYMMLVNYILGRIRGNSTVLVFTDSRRRAERLCYFINQEAAQLQIPGPVSFAHHGSLSKELRQSVERRLAAGQLPCVVATASLELGIDIGSVDEVVLAGSPGSVSQALQRIGRSGHSVGKVSLGRLFPFTGMDLLLGAALKNAVMDRDIEETRPIESPLDVLAQLIIALCTEKTWTGDELYSTLRGFYVFRNLNKEAYNRTLRMLAGYGEKGRLREIKPRIRMDGITGDENREIAGLDGNLLLLYSSGGVIANRGLYSMRLADGGGVTLIGDPGVKIGELDEEFVWERRVGDHFSFGGKGWRITSIGSESVEVKALEKASDYIPFWRADTVFRSPKLTKRLLEILDSHNTSIPPPPTNEVQQENQRTMVGDSDSWETTLAEFLDSQRCAQGGTPLPGIGNLTVEIIDSPENAGDFYPAVIHGFRGGMVQYPLSLALAGELEETLELRVETFSNDDAMLFLLPRHAMANHGSISGTENLFRSAFASLSRLDDASGGSLNRGERLFRNRLETSGVFGANFREAAERSLLLPKAGFGKRTPLWIMRQRAKRLFDTACREDGFPVTAEAWRSCLVDTFDMDGFRDLINSVNDGSIAVSFFVSKTPSPFSRDLVWQETNCLIYEGDDRTDLPGNRAGGTTATLSDKVIQEALGDVALRPVLKRELVDDFTGRLRRETPGWAPEDTVSLCEWIKERIAIPLDEWEALCAAIPEKAGPDSRDPYFCERVKNIKLNGAGIASLVHREWEKSWTSEPLTLLGPWLRYEGPVSVLRIAEVFGVSTADAGDAVNALVEVGEVVRDVALEATPGSASLEGTAVCDRENLEILLRLSRKKARPEIRERTASTLIPFLALRQGIAGAGNAGTDVAFLKKLGANTAAAKLWETEFCVARNANYNPEMLDGEIREGHLVWYGAGKEKIGLCPVEDLDL